MGKGQTYTMFNDVQLLVIAQLQQQHTSEVEALKARVAELQSFQDATARMLGDELVAHMDRCDGCRQWRSIGACELRLCCGRCNSDSDECTCEEGHDQEVYLCDGCRAPAQGLEPLPANTAA